MTPQEAIEYIESCKQTHIDAITYYDEPVDWELYEGDKEFHAQCVNDYNEVLQVMRELV